MGMGLLIQTVEDGNFLLRATASSLCKFGMVFVLSRLSRIIWLSLPSWCKDSLHESTRTIEMFSLVILA